VRRRYGWLSFVVCLLCAQHVASAAPGKTLDAYRHFRAISIDLVGRAPNPAELAAFERPHFDLDAWIDKQLGTPAYADRLARIYFDLLRLEVGPAFTYAPQVTTLHRQQILGPDGKPLYIYFRHNQRRERPETDGELCLTAAESGIALLPNNQVRGTPIAVSQKVLSARTTVVKPWWLYRDFAEPMPMMLYRQLWAPDPLFQPVDELVTDPDQRPTVEIRVCNEEAQTAPMGHIFTTGRNGPPVPQPGRVRPLPVDDGYAKQHKGEAISCRSALALNMSVDCGCGPGLQFCLPGSDGGNDPRAFALPAHTPLGLEQPLDSTPQSVSNWYKRWWSEEALHYLTYLFSNDRDIRELLTGRYSMVNGPLVQFYRAGEPAGCCGREKNFGMTVEAEPLFDAKNLPEMEPSDLGWRVVADRGAHAAGLLTMPVFLTKYASRRARGAVLYNAFLCKSFLSGNAQLQPSTEPNLMIRPGCATCHATLEPLAAYFSRVEETQWIYLPEWYFPLRNFTCRKNGQGKMAGGCDTFYDPAFSNGQSGLLRGAYASLDHAASGPVGAAEAVTAAPEFAGCAARRITESFLGRALTEDDTPLLETLTTTLTNNGYRPRALVRALVRSQIYRHANNSKASP